ncbi:MAG TPA: hypothetical protein VF476_07475 [Chitinophagaceae bacterium]
MKKTLFTWSNWKISSLLSVVFLALTVASCNKDNTEQPERTAIEKYSNYLPAATIQELMAAKNATQKYRSLDSAIADGYTNINVVVENMGFHYMKASLADTIFQPEKPEILVYNKQHDGRIELVAVEYAVPIPLMPNKEPRGFTGGADVWTYSTTFNLWLLHAWIWEFNPYGAFTPTNPNVHLH